MKYLIVGLGNIGAEYADTRHNIGFRIVDQMAATAGTSFSSDRYGSVCEVRVKGRTLILLKPSTYMNLSGNAVRYWLQNQKIEVENMLVLVDDIALPFATLRLRKNGSDGGHNGLKHINEVLGTQNYNRLRVGIGGDFPKGFQVDYVLGKWSSEEEKEMPFLLDESAKAVHCFVTQGIDKAMNFFNTNKKKKE